MDWTSCGRREVFSDWHFRPLSAKSARGSKRVWHSVGSLLMGPKRVQRNETEESMGANDYEKYYVGDGRWMAWMRIGTEGRRGVPQQVKVCQGEGQGREESRVAYHSLYTLRWKLVTRATRAPSTRTSLESAVRPFRARATSTGDGPGGVEGVEDEERIGEDDAVEEIRDRVEDDEEARARTRLSLSSSSDEDSDSLPSSLPCARLMPRLIDPGDHPAPDPEA
jgi:hypothetical protein